MEEKNTHPSRPNWTVWRTVPDFSLFEAVALSLDVEPSIVRRGQNHTFKATTPQKSKEFAERMSIVLRNGKRFLISAEEKLSPESKVDRVSFVMAALTLGWVLPSPLMELVRPSHDDRSENEAGAPEALTDAHHGWPSHTTPRLEALKAALNRYWGPNYDPNDPTTAATNKTVIGWLEDNHGLSKSIATAIATILRPDNIKPGPRPR